MGVALAGWWPASKVDDVGAWKGDEQPTSEHLRSRNLLASAVESVKEYKTYVWVFVSIANNVAKGRGNLTYKGFAC